MTGPMTTDGSPDPLPNEAATRLGDAEGLSLLASLVALAPTNLEDPPTGRYEKPRYVETADRLARVARGWGFPTRIFDPTAHAEGGPPLPGGPRPSVIVDLDVGAAERVLLLAHYDVVPVPSEQRARWRSPPHVLTYRSEGRLYGRGANDDLGSGVVASLLALRRLKDGEAPRRNVRLLICCDEETGGAGGVEAMKEHDARLPAGDPGRFLAGDVALLPDGSPHTTAGSCGVAFLDAGFERPVPLAVGLDFGEMLVGLHERVRAWRSRYPSPDWPDHGAPEPVITGRATVTRFDVRATPGPWRPGQLVVAHAETEASNQIAEAVTLAFAPLDRPGPSLLERVRLGLAAPFRADLAGASAVQLPEGVEAVRVVGVGAHGGYPHRGHNPVPAAFGVLRHGLATRWIPAAPTVDVSLAVDLRLLPEMTLEDGLPTFLGWVNDWIRSAGVPARIDAPPGRCRGGYALPIDHPAVQRLDRLLTETVGTSGVYGEYGGTDASTLADLRTPAGEPLPALVFGSMDRVANIHEAEESVDPTLLAGISRVIERFVREP